MARCIIFCAAGFESLLVPIRPQDFVIAADGGLEHTQKLGITPNGILGDFDSLGYVPDCAQVFPVEKDDTDSMLAIKKGLELGYRDFFLYGSLDGPRLDHTAANFQALQYVADHGGVGYLIGNSAIVTVLKNGSMEFSPDASGTISVFCSGWDARGITLENLYYPLENGTLTAGFPLGVSNHFTGKAAKITVKDGSLMIIWERQAGLPDSQTLEGYYADL